MKMNRIIASSTRIMPMTRKTTGMLKLKLRGGDLENQNCGNCTPAPLKISCTKYGTTKPMTKPRIKSVNAIFMAMMPNDSKLSHGHYKIKPANSQFLPSSKRDNLGKECNLVFIRGISSCPIVLLLMKTKRSQQKATKRAKLRQIRKSGGKIEKLNPTSRLALWWG